GQAQPRGVGELQERRGPRVREREGDGRATSERVPRRQVQLDAVGDVGDLLGAGEGFDVGERHVLDPRGGTGARPWGLGAGARSCLDGEGCRGEGSLEGVGDRLGRLLPPWHAQTTTYEETIAMAEKITAEKRTEFGKGAARRIRRDDKIPAVVYGHGNDP